ncbi:DUF4344 domain-containing metallopeptidase [Aliivibrio kagoshimensis]|uniref:DUF4344 domain-containing metallopeptidase n=1 Tax=Aliivibrio kagoshimensis TaxID=2910230 RepID=UPI003D0F231C
MTLKTLLLSAFLFISSGSLYANETVTIEYLKPNDAQEQQYKEIIENSPTVAQVQQLITQNFALSRPLLITFGGEEGPLFDPQLNQIFVPYHFLTEIEARFSKEKYSESGVSVETAVMDSLVHTLLHEFGHALIAMHDLPVLGKEEDAVDGFANIMLIAHFKEGAEMVISAADLFDFESSDRTELSAPDFWDEHSLDLQRYFTSICHVYGSDPDKYDELLKSEEMLEERGEFCLQEYNNLEFSWYSLLEKYQITK